jgi:predicted RNase H-like HicB family nuclease
MNELIFQIDDDPDGGYNARALGYAIFTQGDTWDEVVTNVREATELYFGNSEHMPKVLRLHYVRDEVMAL